MASVRNNGAATSRAPFTPGSDEHITTFVYEYDRGSQPTSVSDPVDAAKPPPAVAAGRRRGPARPKRKGPKSRGGRGPVA